MVWRCRVLNFMIRLIRWLRRWKYVALTFRSYGKRLNRSVEVEQALLDVAARSRPALTPEECRDLAIKLGVPEEYRRKP